MLQGIGRADFVLTEPYWTDLFRFASDEVAKVRLSFICASENIATTTPDVYAEHMPIYETLLHDADDNVRMEAPEFSAFSADTDRSLSDRMWSCDGYPNPTITAQ